MGINNVCLTGRLGKDAELKNSASGTAICSFSVAVEHLRKEDGVWRSEVSFIDLAIFGDRATSLHPYLVKGKEVGIVGHLEKDQWEKDGVKHSQLAVKVDQISLLAGGGKKPDEGTPDEPHDADIPEDGTPNETSEIVHE
ncbi:hypothetical protein FACS189473_2010 [Spirochaetia bacterium]|nr:hypothetical protein FACS189473_2010 [Spirochaetia bacterium]